MPQERQKTLDIEENRRSELGEPIELKIIKADPKIDPQCSKEEEKSSNKEDIDSKTEKEESQTVIQAQTSKKVEDIVELPDADIGVAEFNYLP